MIYSLEKFIVRSLSHGIRDSVMSSNNSSWESFAVRCVGLLKSNNMVMLSHDSEIIIEVANTWHFETIVNGFEREASGETIDIVNFRMA